MRRATTEWTNVNLLYFKASVQIAYLPKDYRSSAEKLTTKTAIGMVMHYLMA